MWREIRSFIRPTVATTTWAPARSRGCLLRDRLAAEHGDDLDVHVLRVGTKGLGYLDAELARRGEHDRLQLLGLGIQVLKERQAERRRLAGSGLRLADYVVTVQELGNRLLLDRRGLVEAQLFDRRLNLLGQSEFLETFHVVPLSLNRGTSLSPCHLLLLSLMR